MLREDSVVWQSWNEFDSKRYFRLINCAKMWIGNILFKVTKCVLMILILYKLITKFYFRLYWTTIPSHLNRCGQLFVKLVSVRDWSIDCNLFEATEKKICLKLKRCIFVLNVAGVIDVVQFVHVKLLWIINVAISLLWQNNFLNDESEIDHVATCEFCVARNDDERDEENF